MLVIQHSACQSSSRAFERDRPGRTGPVWRAWRRKSFTREVKRADLAPARMMLYKQHRKENAQ
jgi:hypothetical protein